MISFFDLALIIILAWTAIRGYMKGFISSIATLAALLLGIWGASTLFASFGDFIKRGFSLNTQYHHLIAFSILFILIIVLVLLTGKLVEKLVDNLSLGIVNRIAGAIFGVLKTLFFISILLVLLNKIEASIKIIPEKQKQNSFLFLPLSNFAVKMFPYLQFNNFKNNIEMKIMNEPPAIEFQK